MTDYEVLNIPYPYGFSIWIGKLKAILTSEKLKPGRYLITTNDEAFGFFTLDRSPKQMALSEVVKHDYYRYTECELQFYFNCRQPIFISEIDENNFARFKKTLMYRNGTLIKSGIDKSIYDRHEKLPSKIIIQNNAVVINDGKFNTIVNDEFLNRVISTMFPDIKPDNETIEGVPLYQLALIKSPAYKLMDSSQTVKD